MEQCFDALQGKEEETLQDLRKKLSQGTDENHASYLSYIKATTSHVLKIDQFSDILAATWADEYMQSNPLPPPPPSICKPKDTMVTLPKPTMIDEEESIVLSTEMTVGGMCGSPNPLLVDNFVDQDDTLESYIPSGLNTRQGVENVRESLLAELADQYEQSCQSSSSSNVNKETLIETVGDDDDDDNNDDDEHNDQDIGGNDHEMIDDDGFTEHLEHMPTRAKEVFLALGTEKEKLIREQVCIESNVDDSFIVSPFVNIVD